MNTSNKLADVGAAASAGGWFVLHVGQISLGLQWAVAVVAIVSGIAAAWYHIKAGRRL
jgi:hypothetical protein